MINLSRISGDLLVAARELLGAAPDMEATVVYIPIGWESAH